jgi:hypothetical protein
MEPKDFFNFTTPRRTFLKFLSAAAVLGSTAGIEGCAGYPAAPDGLAFLDDKTHAVILAFADRIIPRSGAFPEGAVDLDVVSYFDTIVSDQPPEIQKNMKSGLLLIEYGAPFFQFTFKRFTRMSDEERDTYLRCWENSRVPIFRGIFCGFKNLCCLGFFSNENIFPHIGYDGPWI